MVPSYLPRSLVHLVLLGNNIERIPGRCDWLKDYLANKCYLLKVSGLTQNLPIQCFIFLNNNNFKWIRLMIDLRFLEN